jgi:hypothetical protein
MKREDKNGYMCSIYGNEGYMYKILFRYLKYEKPIPKAGKRFKKNVF